MMLAVLEGPDTAATVCPLPLSYADNTKLSITNTSIYTFRGEKLKPDP